MVSEGGIRELMNSRNAFGIGVRRRELQTLVGVMIALAWSIGSFSQTRQTKPVSQSELARQNLAHVAADTQQLALILHRDAGLMVEVKRWIAKDATDHGQIITENDLAEEVIFDRLENDITFRSVVTQIVQKYGYLLPIVNPESPLAKQQDLLIQERVKWITEEEAADREKMKAEQEKLASQQNCDPRRANCAAQNAATPSIQQLPPQQQQQFPGVNQYPQAVPGLEPPIDVPPTVPYAPQQPTVPGGNGTDLLRTSGPDTNLGVGQQAQAGGGTSGLSDYGQDSDEEGGGNYQRRTSAGGMQSQGQGGFDEFGDLSLDSDFAGDGLGQGMYGSMNRFGNNSGYANGFYPYASPNGSYGNTSYGTGNQTNYYDLSVSNAILRENARRAREPMTPNQRLVRRSSIDQSVGRCGAALLPGR
jgi:hypothetical protein